MSDRRKEERAESSDRRSFPRPSLRLNLVLLTLAALLAIVAVMHRQRLNARFDTIMSRSDNTPQELKKLREELVRSGLSGEALKRELESRTEYIQSLQSDRFYLSLDTRASTLTLYLGNEPAREMKVAIGAPTTVRDGDRSWTFAPLRGSFRVQKKRSGGAWKPEPWAYLASGQPVPADPPAVPNGLGEFVIELPNGYIIHSPPSPDSPLKGAKPGSFMVPADDLRAIWGRITEGTRVYIF